MVAVTGFFIAAVVCPIAVLEPDPYISAALFCLAVFGLELVVGNAWAVTLDIGGNFAGSVLLGDEHAGQYRRHHHGGRPPAISSRPMAGTWPSIVVAGLALIGGLLFLFVDASRQIYAEPAITPTD